VTSDALLRLLITLLIFGLLVCLEIKRPRRRLSKTKLQRWPGNLIVALGNGLLVRSLLPWLVPVLVAQQAMAMQFGLLNQWLLPLWLELVITILILDVLVYWQHRMFHRIPLLWRLHRLHHTDTGVDVTTALRFHPFEIALSLAIKSLVVWLLGAPVFAVLLFEVLLNGLAMFNHSNIKLSIKIDTLLRKIIVTPDMHRVHHSVLADEHNSNFGFNLTCWDRWFGSYTAQPRNGHQQMRLGLNETNRQQTGSVMWMLKQPFK
jgi:sterol desaturase/sphingolipid hydroxylase (fatty acid hydroxylase superfamily)